jgi:hypothetical protein
VPAELGPGTRLQFLFDNGDSPWYDDGIAAKDLPDGRLKKAASLRVAVDVAFPAAALTVSAGSPQTTPVNTPFAQPLAVRVTDAYGHALAGASVAFTAPTDGASAVLSAANATSGADGVASVTATANDESGAYVVVARVAGIVASVAFALDNAVDESDVIFRDAFEAATD